MELKQEENARKASCQLKKANSAIKSSWIGSLLAMLSAPITANIIH